MKNNLILIFVLLLNIYISTSQDINFADLNLKNYLLTKNCIDTNNDGVFNSTADFNEDGEIQISEALDIERLSIFDFQSENPINSIIDLNQFLNLKRLDLLQITAIQFFENMQFVNLEYLWIGSCYNLKRVDISNLPNITYLKIEDQFGLEYLNLQNGTFPTELFSLFYTEHILEACIDDIAQEYEEVAWRMTEGNLPTVNCTLVVEDNEVGFYHINVYPNPVGNVLIFNSNVTIRQLKIVDYLGRTVLNIEKLDFLIDISSLKSGIYLISFYAENKIYTKKIIKI